jgi:chromosome segregation ATPase
MAEDENDTLEPDEPENVGLAYLHRISARLDSIEGKLDEAVVRLAAIERDVAAMRNKLDKLDRRVAQIEGRVDMQRELAKLAAELEA